MACCAPARLILLVLATATSQGPSRRQGLTFSEQLEAAKAKREAKAAAKQARRS